MTFLLKLMFLDLHTQTLMDVLLIVVLRMVGNVQEAITINQTTVMKYAEIITIGDITNVTMEIKSQETAVQNPVR